MFLSQDELKQMTQRSKRPLQKEWLKHYRIPFTEGGSGRLNVLRAYVERAHGLKDVATERTSEETEPNLNAFKRRA
jgi:hypothetical protein